ncbi:2-amino-4-hydroxy-6-hydroxymethyldihydropteridine diphosphokinase [Arenimonas sp.]|uniref:2-amino-4-hydroxy-6- hydroxymethyldihydropteridine diphosphokinase n=1 Tax=Arenimonas sp. TaxID=1872635 RepID=UPI0035B24078
MTPTVPVPAWVAIGGNQGEVRATLEAATGDIGALAGTRVLAASAIYRTPAWGRTDQPDFLNGVLAIETTLPAPVLLEGLLAIERRFGRTRAADDVRWGPRTLDLDLLLYGDQVLELPGLSLPHPRLHERAFVLVPLAEISPELVVPGRGPVGQLLAKVDASGIEAIP